MRLDKRYRRFYNFRHAEAQRARPSCVLLSNKGIDEDGLFYIHFSCLVHEMTSWREYWSLTRKGHWHGLEESSYNRSICTQSNPALRPIPTQIKNTLEKTEETTCEDSEGAEALPSYGLTATPTPEEYLQSLEGPGSDPHGSCLPQLLALKESENE